MKKRYEMTVRDGDSLMTAVCWDKSIESAFERLTGIPEDAAVRTTTKHGNNFFAHGGTTYCITEEPADLTIVIPVVGVHLSELKQSKLTTSTSDVLAGLI